MKVSLVLNAYIGPAVRDGTGKEGFELAMALDRRGVLGRVFCLGAASATGLPAGTVVPACKSRLCMAVLRYLGILHKRFPALRIRRRVERWMDAMFARRLDAQAGDVLYCPKPLYPGTFARAHVLGMRVIVETSVLHPRHNLEVVGRERARLGLRGTSGYLDERRVRMMERALAGADTVFAWSPFLRDSYVQYGLDPVQVRTGAEHCEPPGVDVDRFRPAVEPVTTQEFVVVHVSSITVIKGVQYLVQAWQSLRGKVNGRLLLVGPLDRDMQILRARWADPGIEWTGSVRDPLAYYQRATIFVSPSISDAGPRTVLESMACGVPAIVSDQCGIAGSIEPGGNGFVYHYDDVPALAGLIERCYRDRDLVRSMGRAARETVQGYSIGNYPAEVWQRLSLAGMRQGAEIE